MNWLLVLVGGALGAPLRYVIDRGVQARHEGTFPWGTFTVNMLGCLILGVVTGATLAEAAPTRLHLLLGTGLCGALTTYSTFSYESLRLVETGARGWAVANVLGSVAAGMGALLLGHTVAHALWG